MPTMLGFGLRSVRNKIDKNGQNKLGPGVGAASELRVCGFMSGFATATAAAATTTTTTTSGTLSVS